ncbi:nucleolar protein Jip5, putative [Talaromyces stipitatus ATCC 10500]|uniref:WD repeat-containing protein JIP5 n=1 Tax=Talaromyces stipitatus (strain ATCC 10500 / CBS 375.48 / QM 6759 / NRRL 1006) TaxID=441959 RepID=B8MEB8_TALSN|nr:nucleolar protein Jip5, putative [Talaromyces stipitatus ATCC 10500]EED16545.1 nucleolar protein Jip5, putative [Talaromyces stipitatus ATCC 10500]
MLFRTYETVCTLPLKADLFAQAVHPQEPIVSVGLSSGHVETLRLPSAGNSEENDNNENDDDEDIEGSSRLSAANGGGTGHIDTVWSTRRHKGSCRCLTFGIDGETLYSAGTDGIVKAAKSETGVVVNKIVIPPAKSKKKALDNEIDSPSLIHAISPQNLLLATDSGALHVYDLRIPYSRVSARPEQTYRPHGDYISSLTALPPSDTSTSGYSKQWVTTGGTTLAATDLRRGILRKSEDQEEELISSAYIGGLPKTGTSVGEKVLVGSGTGVLTLWEKGVWDDQDERIYVARESGEGEALESMAVVPSDAGYGKMVAVGQSDGQISLVSIGRNKVMDRVRHDEVEGVTSLGFDVEGRMVSGGGQVVKVWSPSIYNEGYSFAGSVRKFDGPSYDLDSDESYGSDESDLVKEKKIRKKRKKDKGKSSDKEVMGFADLD